MLKSPRLSTRSTLIITPLLSSALAQVRHIGLSNETPYGVMKFTELAEREGYPKVISLQNSYSLLVRSDYEVLSPSLQSLYF